MCSLRRWISRTAPVAAICLLPALSIARDPPSVAAPEAVAAAESAFIGRVVALKELKRYPPYVIQAEATVVVGRCLRGKLCKTRTLRIRHYPEVADEGLPINLEFGEQYLFALRTTAAPKGSFDFGDHDLAWKIGSRLAPDFTEGSAPAELVSLWGRPHSASKEVSFNEVVSWASTKPAEKRLPR